MTKVYYEVDGKPVPADDCTWVITAPCGCDCSWMRAPYYASEDAAWMAFSCSKQARKRDEALGFRLKIVAHENIQIRDDCPHDPKFGQPPRVTLAGHTWMASDTGRVLHLVPLEVAEHETVWTEIPNALCGTRSGYMWSTKQHYTEGRTDCTRCVRMAGERASGGAS